jgi:hypothetical protein
MASEQLSAIISTRTGVDPGSCLRALDQQSGPIEVIQVDGARGLGAARNAAAYGAEGEILVFIDGETIVEPGWAEALRGAFEDGASLVGGGIISREPENLTGRCASRWSAHDEEGRNGFLPFVSGAHLAVRRDVFIRLGGFDEHTSLRYDVDLSLRAQLAGYPIVFVPEARLVQPSTGSVRGLVRERLRRARADRMTELRFRRFPFMSLGAGSPVGRTFASSAASLLMTRPEGDLRRLGVPLLDAGIAAAGQLGNLSTNLGVAAGLLPLPPAIAYRDPEQHNTSAPLPGPPSFLLLGDDRLVMALLRLACEGGDEVILAPPGQEREALPLWDEPAPWSLRLVRDAVRAGWPLALENAAWRVEREQPRTWGEAFLTLHRVHAWAHERRRYGVAALGPSGYELALRLPDVPIVVAGGGGIGDERIVLRVTRSGLLRDRRALGTKLSRLIAPDGRDPTA